MEIEREYGLHKVEEKEKNRQLILDWYEKAKQEGSKRSVNACCEHTGLSRPTVYRHLKEINSEAGNDTNL